MKTPRMLRMWGSQKSCHLYAQGLRFKIMLPVRTGNGGQSTLCALPDPKILAEIFLDSLKVPFQPGDIFAILRFNHVFVAVS
jgi:hypothetical protein